MTFPKILRLFFVAFFLYIIGDAFYRWDAFDFYGSFLEFLPGVALIAVLWSILSLLSAVTVWLLFKAVQKLLRFLKLRITVGNLLIFFSLFVLLGLAAAYIKTSVWPLAHVASQGKLIVICIIAVMALLSAYMLRSRTEGLLEALDERISPLVWIFGILVFLCVPLISYLAWNNRSGHMSSALTSGHPDPDTGRPNIILVTFDALTARDMSVYGYGVETTPFISRWADSATVFTRHQAASNYTAPTTATLMTGKRVWSHRRFQSHGGKPEKNDTESLPRVLMSNGYSNMAFIANHIASVNELGMTDSFIASPLSYEFMSPSSVFGMLRMHMQKLFGSTIRTFDWIIQEDFILYKLLPDQYFKYPVTMQYPVESVTATFLEQIKNYPRKPYFAWLHLYPPHLPYLAPGDYTGMFNSSAELRTAQSQDDLVRPRYFSREQHDDAEVLRARYDEFIRYCDDEFRHFIEQLTIAGLAENTVIILSSDHGESFEHAYFTHGGPDLYEPMTHIPLIVKEPGQQQGRKVHDVVDQSDVAATILDLAGISVPPWMDGRSLVPLLRGEDLRPGPVYSVTLIEVPVDAKIKTGTVAVWEGDYKLIHYINDNISELYDLAYDPDESVNLFASKPDTGRRMLLKIKENIERVNKKYKDKSW